jgi:hypothetical protein
LIPFCETHKELKALNITWNHRFSAKFMHSLALNCPKLKFLTISHCTQYKESFAVFTGFLQNLEFLSIDRAPLLLDHGLNQMIQGSANKLNTLVLNECPKLTDEGLAHAISQCANLSTLELNNIPEMTDKTVTDLPERLLGNIKSLSVGGCAKLTDLTMEHVMKHNQRLQTLQLNQVPQISKDLFMKLSKVFGPYLNELNVSWCRNFDDHCADQIMKHNPKLTKLSLWGCNRISDFEIAKLYKQQITIVGRDQLFADFEK